MRIIDSGTAEIVMHPVRFRILQFIKDASEPQFVEQIAAGIGDHPRLVSHHLNVLQEIGLVECSYEVAKPRGSKKRSVAVRFCRPTAKLTEVFKDVAEAANIVAEVK
jgi:DNA-binding transcriptional ArsR family regulator